MEAPFGRPLAASLFLLLLLHFWTDMPSCSATNTDFIKTSCNSTTYPLLCFRSLSIYATKIKTDPKLLVNTALNVTLGATRSTQRLMRRASKIHGLKPREAAAMTDCVEEVGASVEELKMSMEQMSGAGGSDFWTRMSNTQTWVSAALPDDDTCMDGFAGKTMDGNVKRIVRKHILKISHLTSNALDLVNNYASSCAVSP